MPRLFLIRHGRPSSTWGGADNDPGLAEEGWVQAERAAQALLPFGALDLASSPMRRCMETASPYAKLVGLTPRLEPRVSEVVADESVTNRGAWLQQRFPWRDPAATRTWSSLEPALHDWRGRMLDYISGLEKDTAVFSHFIAINVIVGAALQRDATIVCKPDHASITELALTDGVLSVVRLGAEMQVDDVR